MEDGARCLTAGSSQSSFSNVDTATFASSHFCPCNSLGLFCHPVFTINALPGIPTHLCYCCCHQDHGCTLYHCFRVLLFVFLSQPTLLIIKTRSRQEKTTWEKPPPTLVHTHWTQYYNTRKLHRTASPNESIVFSQARKGCARVFTHSIAAFHTHKGPGLRQS